MFRNKILFISMLILSEFRQSVTTASTDPSLAPKILKRSKRVVGGHASNIERLPYMVNIRRDGVFECGGAFITPNCVLTAAHCIKTGQAENFTVRGGNTYLDDKRNSRRVQQIFMHEQYDNKTLNNDIAIFKLEKVRHRRLEVFTAIKYATTWAEMPQAGDSVRVSGWGLTSETATRPSNQLRSVQVDVMSQTQCQKLYQNYRNVTTNMFCAAVPGRKDACSADSGGPAVFKSKIVGIVSWGKGYECARANSPGVYVNVVAFNSWIDGVLRGSCLS